MKNYNFKVIIEQDEDGYFVARCPDIQGCHTQGETYEEALRNIKEAIELCLEVQEEESREEFTEVMKVAARPRLFSVDTVTLQLAA